MAKRGDSSGKGILEISTDSSAKGNMGEVFGQRPMIVTSKTSENTGQKPMGMMEEEHLSLFMVVVIEDIVQNLSHEVARDAARIGKDKETFGSNDETLADTETT